VYSSLVHPTHRIHTLVVRFILEKRKSAFNP
jgi:hypothetical protein